MCVTLCLIEATLFGLCVVTQLQHIDTRCCHICVTAEVRSEFVLYPFLFHPGVEALFL